MRTIEHVRRKPRLWGIGFTAFAISIVGWAASPESLRTSTTRPPNIIFILAHDLGYGDLGCYGQTRIKTPNIDKLAAEGMRFTDFYAGSTVCAPSRCALMTGLHTGHAYVRGNANLPLRAQDRTVAEVLKDAGYYTALIGKWGLGDQRSSGAPQNKGFDQFVGYLDQVHAHDYYTDHLARFDPKYPDQTETLILENQAGKKGKYIPDLLSAAALNFLKINKPDQFNHYRPFFLYFADIIPHANNEEATRSGNGMQVPSDGPYSDEPWPQVEKNKAAMITRLDADVGKVMEKLKELKLDENTIVFFSSDNGPHKEGGVDPNFFESAGPFRGIKRDLYEGGIRVPFIVRWPAAIKAGQTNDRLGAFWDLLPTVAQLAGAKYPTNLDGISLLPAFLGQPQTNRHEFLYFEFHERGFQQAVRMGDWKAVRPQSGQRLELYNLKSDPGEKQNIADKNPAIIAQIEDYLKTARADSERFPIKPQPTDPNEEKKKPVSAAAGSPRFP